MPLGIGNLGGFPTSAAVSGHVSRRNDSSRGGGSSSCCRTFVGLRHAALFFRGSLGSCVAAELVDVVDDTRLLRELLRLARQLQVLNRVGGRNKKRTKKTSTHTSATTAAFLIL